jgi:hypothetical protein
VSDRTPSTPAEASSRHQARAASPDGLAATGHGVADPLRPAGQSDDSATAPLSERSTVSLPGGIVTPFIPTLTPRVVNAHADWDDWPQDLDDAPPPRDEWWDPAPSDDYEDFPNPHARPTPVARKRISPLAFKTVAAPPTSQSEPQPPRLDDPPRLLSVDEVLNLQSPKPLIKHLIGRGALVVVYGPAASAKSFLVLDWGLSIGSGHPWLDHEVIDPGPVVYVAAEGKGGLNKRVRAWLQGHRQGTVPNAFFIPEPVQLLKGTDVDLLVSRLARRPPALVIFDTFAMCFDGDENHSKDMSLAIAAAKRIIRETGATVILVHHTGKRGLNERGHSALRAAADTMILVEAKKDAFGGTLIVVSNTKQKDEEAFPEITARLERVTVGTTDDGEPLTSCVLQSTSATPSSSGELPEGLARTLSILADRFPDGASSTLWRAALQPNGGPQLATRTYHNHREALLERRLIEQIPGFRDYYRATSEGKELLHVGERNTPIATTTDGADANGDASAEVRHPSASGTEPQDGTVPGRECDSRANAADR